MIKVKNNAGRIIEVTKPAYEALYKNRKGFSLYKENKKQIPKKQTKNVDYESLKWGELRKLASEKGINTKGLKRKQIEDELKASGN